MDEKKIDKKLGVLIVAVAVLIVSVTGSTFAFFALSTGDAGQNAITGETAQGGAAALKLTVTPSTLGGTANASVTKSNKYVPQLESALGTAIAEANGCVDGNGNTVCRVYTINIKNTGNATVVVNGTINFTAYNPTNIKWKRIASATTVGELTGVAAATAVSAANQENDLTSGTQCTASVNTGCTNVSLAPNGEENYYIVVWLDEINSDQTDTDASKTFNANITFSANGGGKLTSTIIA